MDAISRLKRAVSGILGLNLRRDNHDEEHKIKVVPIEVRFEDLCEMAKKMPKEELIPPGLELEDLITKTEPIKGYALSLYEKNNGYYTQYYTLFIKRSHAEQQLKKLEKLFHERRRI